MSKVIDLHMHTIVSADGEFKPEEIVELANKAGLKTIAIADHNSMCGVKRAIEAAESKGINVIPATELDCKFKGTNLHLLGYYIEDNNNWFWENEIQVYINELLAGDEMISKVRKLGIVVDDEELDKLKRDGIVTGEMIAEVALQDINNDGNELLKEYREGGSRSDNPLVNFYWDFCSQGKEAHVPIAYPKFEKAISEIKKAGGIPVLAHPGANIGMNEDLVSEMKNVGLKGIEAFSSYHSDEVKEYYNKVADNLNLIKTVGSDFHGKTKPAIKLGEIEIPDEDAEITMMMLDMFC